MLTRQLIERVFVAAVVLMAMFSVAIVIAGILPILLVTAIVVLAIDSIVNLFKGYK